MLDMQELQSDIGRLLEEIGNACHALTDTPYNAEVLESILDELEIIAGVLGIDR